MDQVGGSVTNLEFWRLVLVRNQAGKAKDLISETKVVARNNLKLMIMRNFLGFSPCTRIKDKHPSVKMFTRHYSEFHDPVTLVPLLEPHYAQKRPVPKFYSAFESI